MDASDAFEELKPLLQRLSRCGENDRYKLLAQVLNHLASQPDAADGRFIELTAQIESWSKKARRLDEERALQAHEIEALKVDLEQQKRQYETEQLRGQELARINLSLKSRLETTQKERDELEQRVNGLNTQLTRAEAQCESLNRQVGRLDHETRDLSHVTRIEDERNQLGKQLAQAREEREQLRQDKDAEIANLRAALSKAESNTAQSADTVLSGLWDRLYRSNPPFLTSPAGTPTVPAAERLFESYIELVRFAAGLDTSAAAVFETYARNDQGLKQFWETYRKNGGVEPIAKQVIAVTAGRQVNVLKIRLRGLKNVTMSFILGAHGGLENLPEAVRSVLEGPMGLQRDPNRKVKDLLREGGDERIAEVAKVLFARKILESIQKGLGNL